MKYINTILAILLTSVNIFRYNLPVYLNDISIFDILGLVALLIACSIAMIKERNVLIEGLLIYNIIGCVDSIVDEIWLSPTLRTFSEWKAELGIIAFCIGYMVYRVKVKGKPLL